MRSPSVGLVIAGGATVTCDRTTYCKIDATGATTTCMLKQAAGAACNSDGECASDQCRSATFNAIPLLAAQRFCH